MPLISICIPAYKRVELLRRLIESILIQSFKDFEVIITDDSPDDLVMQLCESYQQKIDLRYFRNPLPLGTPENWNEGIRKATGQWIKIMHGDDWFASAQSLQQFVDLIRPEVDFIFSASSIHQEHKMPIYFSIGRFEEKLLKKDVRHLFHKNFIGPPSVILHRNDKTVWYDRRMKWLVDVDFYMAYLQQHKYVFTRAPLINVGFNEGQVTNQVIHDRNIVIPETNLLLSKTGTEILKAIWNFDFAWRLMRNYRIRTMADLTELNTNNPSDQPNPVFLHIIQSQARIPNSLLKIGIFSKAFMFVSYIRFRSSKRK